MFMKQTICHTHDKLHQRIRLGWTSRCTFKISAMKQTCQARVTSKLDRFQVPFTHTLCKHPGLAQQLRSLRSCPCLLRHCRGCRPRHASPHRCARGGRRCTSQTSSAGARGSATRQSRPPRGSRHPRFPSPTRLQEMYEQIACSGRKLKHTAHRYIMSEWLPV